MDGMDTRARDASYIRREVVLKRVKDVLLVGTTSMWNVHGAGVDGGRVRVGG